MSRAAGDASVFSAYGSGRRKVVVFGIPSLGRVSLRFLEAHYRLAQPTNASVIHVYCEGKPVAEARNQIVAQALAFDDGEREVTHVFFLDDDVLPHSEAFKKLAADGRDVVAGLYYLKTAVPTPMVLMDDGDGVARSWVPGELVECSAHGMGLTLVRAEVFRRMRDETDIGTDEFGLPAWFRTLKDQRVLTPQGHEAHVNETEDVYFLRRARSLGYRPCVDTSAQAFGWHWAQAEQRAYPLKQWAEYVRTRRVTWDADAGGPPVVWEQVA